MGIRCYVVFEEQVVGLEYVSDDNGPDSMRPEYAEVPIAVFELKEDAERAFSRNTIKEVSFITGMNGRSRLEEKRK